MAQLRQFCPTCGGGSVRYLATDGANSCVVQAFCGTCDHPFMHTWIPECRQFIARTDPDGGDPVRYEDVFGKGQHDDSGT